MVIAFESVISWSVQFLLLTIFFIILKPITYLRMSIVLYPCQDADVFRNEASFLCLSLVPQNKGKKASLFVQILTSPANHTFVWVKICFNFTVSAGK
jgi:hypothetical protein